MFFLRNKTVFETSPNMNLETATHSTHITHIAVSHWYIYKRCVYGTQNKQYTHFKYITHIAMRAREARAADRGVRCMIRSVFFLGFLRPLFMIHEELGEAGASAEYYDEREY